MHEAMVRLAVMMFVVSPCRAVSTPEAHVEKSRLLAGCAFREKWACLRTAPLFPQAFPNGDFAAAGFEGKGESTIDLLTFHFVPLLLTPAFGRSAKKRVLFMDSANNAFHVCISKQELLAATRSTWRKATAKTSATMKPFTPKPPQRGNRNA
jgi:hypothetical protein